jgi:hypothetical protein
MAKTRHEELDAFDGILSKQRSLCPCEGRTIKMQYDSSSLILSS